jgi:hypothetical protein
LLPRRRGGPADSYQLAEGVSRTSMIHKRSRDMIRAVIRLHTGILVLAAFALLITPASILTAFGVADPTFPMFALARV